MSANARQSTTSVTSNHCTPIAFIPNYFRIQQCGRPSKEKARKSHQIATCGRFLTDREGFEPSVRFWRTHDFQSCSFDLSDTCPMKSGRNIREKGGNGKHNFCGAGNLGVMAGKAGLRNGEEGVEWGHEQ